MQIWIISFFLLLGLVEGFDWLKHLTLPMPVMLLGGALLAIVSNGTALMKLPQEWHKPLAKAAQEYDLPQGKPHSGSSH